MDQNNNNGSFAAPAGGMSPALQAAIQQRATQGGVTQQVTNGAPGGQPMPQPQGNAAQATTGAQNGTPERVDDAHIILKAMAGRLKSQEKIAEAQAIPPKMPTAGGM